MRRSPLAALVLSSVLTLTARAPGQGADAGPPPAAPTALPAQTTVTMHLPGADAEQHLNVDVELGSGPDWIIEGCISNAPGICKVTTRETLTAEQRVEYVRLWSDLFTMKPCKPASRPPRTRAFGITSSMGTWKGALPEDAAKIAAQSQGPCSAPARLAAWVAQRFGALP